MTFRERLEKLLNRCGQTADDINDDYSVEKIMSVLGSCNAYDLAADYLYAADIIDRLEWALDSVVRERDFLKEMAIRHGGCPTCLYADPNDRLMCAKYACIDDIPDGCYAYGGVPEDLEPVDE